MRREEMVRKVRERAEQNNAWDIAVVGGGATGMGVAVDAAARGLSVVLIEAHDFGKGTSSRSTKLVHGGVRYLEQGNIPLVMSALKERGLMRQNAPHLVHDLAFVVPNYSWWEAPFYGIGLKLYDMLAGKYGFGASKLLSKEETLERLPALEPEELRGGVVYYDGQFDDARLLIHLAMTAADNGATLVNYCPATGVLRDADGYLNGVTARDEETGEELTIPARMVVNATGVFTDSIRCMADPSAEPLVVTSQGIHLVFDRSFLKGDTALMVPRTSDGRILFVIPWHGHAVAGTTDTPLDAPSLEPRPLDEEIEFILETAARYPPAKPRRCAGRLRGASSIGKGRRQDLGAVERSRHPRGHIRPVDHYRWEVDHLPAHGRGLRGPRHHPGQAAGPAVHHKEPEDSRLSRRLGRSRQP
jgi:glycerol-3-phosphate dehydrogenase